MDDASKTVAIFCQKLSLETVDGLSLRPRFKGVVLIVVNDGIFSLLLTTPLIVGLHFQEVTSAEFITFVFT